MVRTVRVDLEANVGKYIPPVEESTKATEGLNRRIKDTDQELNKIPPDAAKAAASLKLLGDETGKAGVKLDDLGKRSTSMGAIDERIAKTRAEVRGLAEDFNRTGDAGILGRLFSGQKDLQELEKLKKRVSGALEQGAMEGGQEGAKSFTSAMDGGLSTPGLGPILVAVLVGAAVAAAPAIGGVLMGGAALGGIGAGIVGQLHDPAVRKAASDLGQDLSQTLAASTVNFKQPLIDATQQVGHVLKQMMGTVDFKQLSTDIAPFVGGLANLGINIMPGLNKMMAAAGPILASMSNDLAVVGTSLSTMFDEISRGGRGAQETLRMLLYVLGGFAMMVGGVVLGISKLVEWMLAGSHAIGEFEEKAFAGFPVLRDLAHWATEFTGAMNGANDVDTYGRAVNNLGSAAAPTAEGLAKMASALNETKLSADSLEAAMAGKLFSAIMNQDQAILGWHKSLLDLHDTLDQNGRAIDRHTGLVDLNTKSGLGNREAVLAAMTANMQQYQAFIAAGGGADVATKHYNDNTAALERQLHAAGYNQKQIDDMIGSLKSVPSKVSADIAMNGLTEAINNLGNLLAELNHLNGRNYGFTVTASVYNQGGHQGDRWGGVYEHAAVGTLRDASVYSPANPGRYMIAEPQTGGEAFVPRRGDYGRSTAILDQAARWYGGRFAPGGAAGGGGGGPMVYVTVNAGMGTDGRAVGQQIADVLRPWVASNGGNVQRALAGRTVN